jgi:membrane-associated protease RseP (regulator of RpoE activity)
MEERRTNRTIWIVLGGIALLLVGCILGAMAGGLVGYMAGRAAAPRLQPFPPAPLPRQEFPQMPDTQMMYGALITEVVPDSPAERAGMRSGDVVMAVEDRALDEDYTLVDAVTEYDPGDEIVLHVYRGGRMEAVQVTLGAHPELGDDVAWLGVAYRPMGRMPLNPQVPRGFEMPG